MTDKNTSPFTTQAEAVAYALGYNFGYMAAKLDSIEKSMDRLLEAAATPAQVAFEKRCAAREQVWKKSDADIEWEKSADGIECKRMEQERYEKGEVF